MAHQTEFLPKYCFTSANFVYYPLTGTGSGFPSTSHVRLEKPTFDAFGVRGGGSEIKSNKFDFASFALHTFVISHKF
jgi:hypothetical protein